MALNVLKHVQSCPGYSPGLRQLLHVGYKIAAKMGDTYLDALRENEEIIAEHVTQNIYDRHIKPLRSTERCQKQILAS